MSDSCSGTGGHCADPVNDNPLCEYNPESGGVTNQVRAKAYPGLRQLAVLQGLGSRGVVGSICPAQVTDAGAADFGYRPAAAAIASRLKPYFK